MVGVLNVDHTHHLGISGEEEHVEVLVHEARQHADHIGPDAAKPELDRPVQAVVVRVGEGPDDRRRECGIDRREDEDQDRSDEHGEHDPPCPGERLKTTVEVGHERRGDHHGRRALIEADRVAVLPRARGVVVVHDEEEQDHRLVKPVKHVPHEAPDTKVAPFARAPVELGHLHQHVVRQISVKDPDADHGGHSPDGVPEQQVHIVHALRRAPGRVDLEPEQCAGVHHLLVEEEVDHLAVPIVRPVAVHQQQALEEAELADGVVGRVYRLQTLLACNADTDLGRLDHRHVIGTVADGQRDGLELVPHKAHHERLLQWAHTAAHHDAATRGHTEHQLLRELLLHDAVQRTALDHQRKATGPLPVVFAHE